KKELLTSLVMSGGKSLPLNSGTASLRAGKRKRLLKRNHITVLIQTPPLKQEENLKRCIEAGEETKSLYMKQSGPRTYVKEELPKSFLLRAKISQRMRLVQSRIMT